MWAGDSTFVLHVAKTGNDGNSGIAAAYPVDLANDAKLTIGNAITNCPDGGMIIIWPGTYDEKVVISGKAIELRGVHRELSLIEPSADGTGVNLDTGCILNNLSLNIQNGSGKDVAIGIDTKSCHRTRIINCNIYSAYSSNALYQSQQVVVEGCIIRFKRRGIGLNGSIGSLIRNCIILSDGVYDASDFHDAIRGYGQLTIDNCVVIAERSDSSSDRCMGIVIESGEAQIAMRNVAVKATGSGSHTGETKGLQVNYADAKVTAESCIFSGEGLGEAYDVEVLAGELSLTGCRYTTSDGTIYAVPDASGYVDTGYIEGTDATDQIDARLKAVTGFTEGGSWTFQKLVKVQAALIAGKKQLKSGETNVYEILDPDDDSTVVVEMTISATSPYISYSVQI